MPQRRRSNGKRGFANMDPAKQRAIASSGGKASHASGRAHEFTSEEARKAGRKGGIAISKNTAHMSTIGKKGGEARGRSRTKTPVHIEIKSTGPIRIDPTIDGPSPAAVNQHWPMERV